MKTWASRLLSWLLTVVLLCIVGVTAWAGCPEREEPTSTSVTSTPSADTTSSVAPVQGEDVSKNGAPESVAAVPDQIPANCTRVKWDSLTFDLPWINYDGHKLYSIDDAELQRLCSYAGCVLSRSFVSNTLMAKLPQREILLSEGAKTMRVNGKDLPLQGLYITKDGNQYVDGNLLWFLLAMKAERHGDEIVIQQTVSAPKFINEGKGRSVVLYTSGSLQYDEYDLEDGSKVCTIHNAVWQGDKSVYDDEDLQVKMVNTAEGNVKVTISCLDSWVLSAHKGISINELVIDVVHTYPKPAEFCALAGMEQREHEANATTLVLVGDNGYWYHWLFDAKTRVLRVDMVGMTPNKLGDVRCDVQGLKSPRLSSVGDAELPITRLTATVQPGFGLDIEAAEGFIGELDIRVAPGEYSESFYDEGSTQGYAMVRGVIVIDPGHGGGDCGACNRSLGMRETDINLDVAWRLQAALEELGWTVVMTRENDVDVSWRNSPDKVELQARCDVANEAEAMLFISLHCNASTSPKANGSSVYWYKRVDKEFAEALNGALGAAIGVRDLGVLREGFYVLRHTEMPAVLVEMAYLSNPHEGKLLRQESFRQRIAKNLAQAVEEYYQ